LHLFRMTEDDEHGAVNWGLENETKVLAQNVSQCNFIYHKSHKNWSGMEPGPPRWEPGD
jgi:hypothetical protein